MTTHRLIRRLATALAIYGIFSATTFADEPQDEGGAPSEVVLRVKGTAGDKKSSPCEIQYQFVANGKTVGPITLKGNINCEVTAADDKQSTRRFSFTKFDSKDDTIGLADMMNKSFMLQFTGSVTSDTRGNSLKQTGYSKPPESYSFPEGPVKVGDTWQGWLGKHETKKPITYTLEKIVRFRGDDIAVISKECPAWQDHKETEWFDVTKGDFVGCTVDETQYKSPGTATIRLSIFDPL